MFSLTGVVRGKPVAVVPVLLDSADLLANLIAHRRLMIDLVEDPLPEDFRIRLLSGVRMLRDKVLIVIRPCGRDGLGLVCLQRVLIIGSRDALGR